MRDKYMKVDYVDILTHNCNYSEFLDKSMECMKGDTLPDLLKRDSNSQW